MHAIIARESCASDPLEARLIAVLVPTRGAGDALRRTVERRRLTSDAAALVLPDLLTRSDFYDALQRQTRTPAGRLSAYERGSSSAARVGGRRGWSGATSTSAPA